VLIYNAVYLSIVNIDEILQKKQ